MSLLGPDVTEVRSSLDVVEIPVGGVGTYYSKAVSLKYSKYHAIAYKATVTTGAPKLKIEIEQSTDLPTTEGAADSKYTVPSTLDDVNSDLTDEDWHNAAIYPIPMAYMRFKITGSGTNDSSATIQFKLSKQEDL